MKAQVFYSHPININWHLVLTEDNGGDWSSRETNPWEQFLSGYSDFPLNISGLRLLSPHCCIVSCNHTEHFPAIMPKNIFK